MGDKPTTTEFLLTLDPPEKINFTEKLLEAPSNFTLKVTNPTKERYVFKIKCTSNEMFRIRPPVGALKPGESANIVLTFNAGAAVPENGKHYFAIYYIASTDEKKAPRLTWLDFKGTAEGPKRLYVDFTKDGAESGEKKEDKKEGAPDGEKEEEKKDSEKK